MLKSIIFLPMCALEKAIPRMDSAVISIVSPGTKRPDLKGWYKSLELTFDDVDRPILGYDLVLFDRPMARKVISFVDEISTKVEVLIVHCEAGISRSGAVAMYFSEKYDIPMSPRHAPLYNRHVFRTLEIEEFDGNLF